MNNEIKNKLAVAVGHSKVVIVCIGTDLLSGDCLGPLMGQMLIEQGVPCFVYGTLSSPVSALNIDKVGELIKKRHEGQLVIAIDSAVGQDVGKIKISHGALKPGSASGKNLQPIGDVSITVVTTNALPHEEGFSLVPLGFVYATAKKLAQDIASVVKDRVFYHNFNKRASVL